MSVLKYNLKVKTITENKKWKNVENLKDKNFEW